jgi:hypothetical protein
MWNFQQYLMYLWWVTQCGTSAKLRQQGNTEATSAGVIPQKLHYNSSV